LSSAQRVMETLGLFTSKQPTWTPERAGKALGISRASAYRYFSILSQARFIELVSGRGYALGPAIVELDRQIRLSDPLVQTSVDVMVGLAKTIGGAILLCRLYKGRVLCIHQERGARVPAFVSYERGRPMPLYRGATSKAILAFLPRRELDELIERDRAEVARAGLPADGAALQQILEPIRERRYCVTASELDPGVCGAAVPLFERSRVIGSLSVALPSVAVKSGALERAARPLMQAGHRIEAELQR
jgi:DNA-binding IclR family transcriptional regulator